MIYVKAIRVKFVRQRIGLFRKTGWYAEWWENCNGDWYSKRTAVASTLPGLFRYLDYLFNRPTVLVIKRHVTEHESRLEV